MAMFLSMHTYAQPTRNPEHANAPEKADPNAEAIKLSPFEVKADAKGYFASNTLSGTRLNSKLEDLGASISVVTKQQMEDFSLTNINDIFLYEANTEGTGTYTDITIDRAGVVLDNTVGGFPGPGETKGPAGANRIRGMGQANIAKGGYAASGRVPIDPINVESIEISRGPNSSIFGLGLASGMVNILPIQANTQKERTKVEMRADSYGGVRAALDHNQPIVANVLAVRGTAVYQEEGFTRDPSYSRTKRYNALMTYKPFKSTTLRASFERYENDARLPNNITPTDGVTYWKENGRPTWDPVTWTVTRNGVKTVVPYNGSVDVETAALGPGLSSAGNRIYQWQNIFIDPDGTVGAFMPGRLGNSNTPLVLNSNIRFMQTGSHPRTELSTMQRGVSDKELYDWSSINLISANKLENQYDSWMVELEQIFLDTPRQLLAMQLGWYHEEGERYRRDYLGSSGISPLRLFLDINERLLDGTPNPYFLRPYLEIQGPTTYRHPLKRDHHRAQLAYQLKLSKDHGWLRWLGDHSFSGYAENRRTFLADYRYRDAIISNHAWIPQGAERAQFSNGTKGYYRFYVGDNIGQNVDYGSARLNGPIGTHTYRWYNGATGQWVNENVTVGEAFWTLTNQNNRRSDSLIKTFGAVWQAHLLNGRVVATAGVRDDSSFNRTGLTRLMPDGYTRDTSIDKEWTQPWILREGRTTTKGIVLKPLRGLRSLDSAASKGGVTGLMADATQSINLHYNESNSFLPQELEQDLFTELLPDPTGKGKDYGIAINIGAKFVLRYNQYEVNERNSRNSENGVLASRVARVETNYNGQNDPFNLYGRATEWVNTLQPGLSAAQREEAIAQITGIPAGRVAGLLNYTISDTGDVEAKGKEIEIFYNPNTNWTVKASIAQQISKDAQISANVLRYIEERLPVWRSIIDPILGTPWYTTTYSTSSASNYMNNSVLAPIKLATVNEGKSRSQVREWKVNVLSTYRLSGITDHAWLSKMAVSGALRWEDKGSIGYYAFANDPGNYDPNRPIYDKSRAYFDFGVSYNSKVYNDKIGMRVQLNVRNAFESGRLQPIGTLPDGTPSIYRIIDPRLIVFTTSFEF